MKTDAKTFLEVLAGIVGAIAAFFTGLPPIIWILLAVITIDYITGILCGLMGKSQKTENGGISSSAAFNGLLRKMLIILVVLLAALLDKAVAIKAGIEFEAVAGFTCLWFIASEGFSIVENAATMGVPIPKVLLQALEIMKAKGGGDESKKQNTKQKKTQPEESSLPISELAINDSLPWNEDSRNEKRSESNSETHLAEEKEKPPAD